MNERGQYGNKTGYIPYAYREGKRRRQWERMTEAERWTARNDETEAERYTGRYDEQHAIDREKRNASPGLVVAIGAGFVGLVMLARKFGSSAPREQLPTARIVKG